MSLGSDTRLIISIMSIFVGMHVEFYKIVRWILYVKGLPYFLVDSGMILLLQDWGFLMMIISMVIFVFMMWRFWKNRQDILIITGIVVALWSMNEDVLISVGMNFLFFAIGANLDISKMNDRMRRRKLEG